MFAQTLVALSLASYLAQGGQDAAQREAPKKISYPTQSVDGVELYLVEAQILKKTNAERARHGLSALVADRNLLATAREHCKWMARSSNLSHTRLQVAENIAMGQQTADEAVRDWMNSSGHRANILNRRHTRIGIAAYVMPGGRIYWCQQFSH